MRAREREDQARSYRKEVERALTDLLALAGREDCHLSANALDGRPPCFIINAHPATKQIVPSNTTRKVPPSSSLQDRHQLHTD